MSASFLLSPSCFYDALKQVTGSRVLISICEQILHDRTKHVGFQSITLSISSVDTVKANDHDRKKYGIVHNGWLL